MDTSLKTAVSPAEIEAQLKVIKDHMPETYKAIVEKAGKIGRPAYAIVRQGVSGKPNKFYAMERGRVVGMPFDLPGVMEDVAMHACAFGPVSWLIWGPEVLQLEKEAVAGKEADHGQG